MLSVSPVDYVDSGSGDVVDLDLLDDDSVELFLEAILRMNV